MIITISLTPMTLAKSLQVQVFHCVRNCAKNQAKTNDGWGFLHLLFSTQRWVWNDHFCYLRSSTLALRTMSFLNYSVISLNLTMGPSCPCESLGYKWCSYVVQGHVPSYSKVIWDQEPMDSYFSPFLHKAKPPCKKIITRSQESLPSIKWIIWPFHGTKYL